MKCTKDLSITITAPEPPEHVTPDLYYPLDEIGPGDVAYEVIQGLDTDQLLGLGATLVVGKVSQAYRMGFGSTYRHSMLGAPNWPFNQINRDMTWTIWGRLLVDTLSSDVFVWHVGGAWLLIGSTDPVGWGSQVNTPALYMGGINQPPTQYSAINDHDWHWFVCTWNHTTKQTRIRLDDGAWVVSAWAGTPTGDNMLAVGATQLINAWEVCEFGIFYSILSDLELDYWWNFGNGRTYPH